MITISIELLLVLGLCMFIIGMLVALSLARPNVY